MSDSIIYSLRQILNWTYSMKKKYLRVFSSSFSRSYVDVHVKSQNDFSPFREKYNMIMKTNNRRKDNLEYEWNASVRTIACGFQLNICEGKVEWDHSIIECKYLRLDETNGNKTTNEKKNKLTEKKGFFLLLSEEKFDVD